MKRNKNITVVRLGNINIGKDFVLIAGPCVIESPEMTLRVAKRLKELCTSLKIPFIFKSSFDKANRMSLDSYRGPGLEKGLEILNRVKKELNISILSDVHCISQINKASKVLDIIQIPAFLCRQTDLIVEAAKTGKVVNIKKGQFMAPWDMLQIIKKIEACGNKKIILTERGVSFGYNNLVSDFRSLGIMRGYGYPVIFDATHSVQLPGGLGKSSSGQREFIAGLSRAAVAFGCDGLFLEVHPNPDKAFCDGPNMLKLDRLIYLLKDIKNIKKALQ